MIWGKKHVPQEGATKPDQSLTGEQLYRRLVRSAALIESPLGAGSGFVVHTGKRLVVTNYHVVGRETRIDAVFPFYDVKGELITDARWYETRIEDVATPGEVIARDVARDLALIRVARLPERTDAVTFARRPASTGSVVYSVGGSGAEENLLWRLTKGNVRGRVKRRAVTDFGVIDCMILETDAPINAGDSGGPVVNDHGELVAVVSHDHLDRRQVSGNIDIEEVQDFVVSHLTPP
jgi:S1-C subfamily serine protease